MDGIVPNRSGNRAQVNVWLCSFPLSLAFCHLPPTPSTPSRDAMSKDHRRLWKDVTNTTSEHGAACTLVEILPEKKGLAFGTLRGLSYAPRTWTMYVSTPLFFRLERFRRVILGYDYREAAFFVTLRGFARRCYHKVPSLLR